MGRTTAIRILTAFLIEVTITLFTRLLVDQSVDVFNNWHDAARTAFLKAAAHDRDSSVIENAHFQLSYLVSTSDGETLPMEQLIAEMSPIEHEVKERIYTGWPMFAYIHSPPMETQSVQDPQSGCDELLETKTLGRERGRNVTIPELWRIAPEGMATLVRAYYPEDVGEIETGKRLKRRQWFWAQGKARDMAELIWHALSFSSRLKNPETISIRAMWRGLKDRKLDTPSASDHELLGPYAATAKTDICHVEEVVAVDQLDAEWMSVTASMVSILLRKFHVHCSISAGHVENWSEKWVNG